MISDKQSCHGGAVFTFQMMMTLLKFLVIHQKSFQMITAGRN